MELKWNISYRIVNTETGKLVGGGILQVPYEPEEILQARLRLLANEQLGNVVEKKDGTL